jgi:hypothetical protein
VWENLAKDIEKLFEKLSGNACTSRWVNRIEKSLGGGDEGIYLYIEIFVRKCSTVNGNTSGSVAVEEISALDHEGMD